MCSGLPLIGRHAEPFERFGVVLFHAQPVHIEIADFCLRRRVSTVRCRFVLFERFEVPLFRLCFIFFYPESVIQTGSQPELSFGKAVFRGFSPPFDHVFSVFIGIAGSGDKPGIIQVAEHALCGGVPSFRRFREVADMLFRLPQL